LIDDEAVALVHAPQELGWMPLSVPWVDYQPTIDALSRQGLLLTGEYKKLLLAGRGLHFSERSYSKAVERCAFDSATRASEILRLIRANRIERKRADADMVLDYVNSVKFGAGTRSWGFSATSHWEMLHAEVTSPSRL